MGKHKKSFDSLLPLAPWIYVDDPTPNAAFASGLTQLIPKTALISPYEATSPLSKVLTALQNTKDRDTVVIISAGKTHDKGLAREDVREQATKRGCNFASINLRYDEGQPESKDITNHLDLQISSVQAGTDTYEVKATAERIHTWLLTVLSIPETLHLMSEVLMKTDNFDTSRRDYEYCSIAERRNKPKDAKIQFIAIILTKPVVGPDSRLEWKVADKTGVANIHFKWRDESSNYTWDWVLKLEPGQRHCLARMPSVKVTESALTTIAVAPFRFTGSIIGGAGCAIGLVGKGLRKVGKKLKMGKRCKWVPEADIKKRHDNENVTSFTACTRGHGSEKLWKDDDSAASTTAGSVVDEKLS